MYLGLCVFFGASKKVEVAIGMSITFTAVMVVSAALIWVIYYFIMQPLGVTFLAIIVFIAIIASFVQTAETIMRKISPAIYYKLGIYLALITANCIILAVPLLNVIEGYGFIESIMLALGAGAGFSLALLIMSSIRERLELANIPRPFQGLPIAFIVTGLIALGFKGFAGMIAL
jgi:electron transport complex protein RnfA